MNQFLQIAPFITSAVKKLRFDILCFPFKSINILTAIVKGVVDKMSS